MKKRSSVKTGLLSVLFAVLCTAAMILVTSLLIANEVIPASAAKPIAMMTLAVSMLAASMYVMKCIEKNRLLIAGCVAAIYTMVCLFAAGLVTPVDSAKLGWSVVVPFAAVLISGVWFGAKKGRRR